MTLKAHDSNVPQDLSLADILFDARKWRWLLFVMFAFCVLAGVAWASLRTKSYEAKVVLAAVTDDAGASGTGGLMRLAAQYGGLAALAGLSPAGGGTRAETIAVLQSELLTSAYIRERGLLPLLFPEKRESLESKPDDKGGKGKVPSVWEGNAFFSSKIRRVTDDTKTGLITMTIRWRDPVVAAEWANDLTKRTNDFLRARAISEAERNIQFLTDQAQTATLLETRRAVNSLLEQEMNKAMLARGRPEFALHIIDPAVPPERPAGVGPIGAGLVGAVLGVLLGALFLLGRRALLQAG